MTQYSAPTIIVVKAGIRASAEDAALTADPAGGAGTFVPGVPLRAVGDATNTVVAYWCHWAMTPDQRSSFATALGGPSNTISAGSKVNLNRDRWVFDAAEGAWTPQQVLDALGYDRIEAPLG